MAKTGRPSKDDTAVLKAMADYSVDNPTVKATAAFRAAITDFTGEHSPDAARKRIVTKFNKGRDVLMQAAAERKRLRDRPAIVRVGVQPTSSAMDMFAGQSLQEALRLASRDISPGLEAVRLAARDISPALEAVRLASEAMSPMSEILAKIAESTKPLSAISQAIAAMQMPESSAARLAAELTKHDSTFARMMVDLNRFHLGR